MLVRFAQLGFFSNMLTVALRIGDPMQVAADDRLRLITLGDRDSAQTLVAVGHVSKTAKLIQEVRPLYEQLCHPGIVVFAVGDMAVSAALGFFCADGVRNIRTERLSAEAFRGHRLLAVVEPIAVLALRAHHDRTRRAHRRNLVPGDGAINAEHVDVVAQDLEVVRGPVARSEAFVVQHRHLLVRGHGKVATEAARCPRAVAGDAGHARIGVSEILQILRKRAPGRAVLLQCFRKAGFLAVMRVAGRDGVFYLNDLPLPSLLDNRALVKLALLPIEPLLLPRSAEGLQLRAAWRCCGAAGDELAILRDAAVAVRARDLYRVTSLSIKLAGAV